MFTDALPEGSIISLCYYIKMELIIPLHNNYLMHRLTLEKSSV